MTHVTDGHDCWAGTHKVICHVKMRRREQSAGSHMSETTMKTEMGTERGSHVRNQP